MCGLCESVLTAELCHIINNCNVLSMGGTLNGGFKAVEWQKRSWKQVLRRVSEAGPEFLQKSFCCVQDIESEIFN